MASQLTLGDLVAREKTFIENPEAKTFFAKHSLEKSGEDGNCIREGCDGRIIKRICGATSFDYIYSVPYCEKCRQEYHSAPSDVPVVGREKFDELMNTPYRT